MSLDSNDSAIKRFTYDWLIRFAELHPFLLQDSFDSRFQGLLLPNRSKYSCISPLLASVIARYMPSLFYDNKLLIKDRKQPISLGEAIVDKYASCGVPLMELCAKPHSPFSRMSLMENTGTLFCCFYYGDVD
uniref:Calponin-homology (CH) domain-containing protein n=1 Tax=Panagrellus redivivus TaxID=6233 RepID=A0A7E4VC75_PANRE